MSARLADRERGFTLVELLVALALFGLIAVAGLALVENTLAIRTRTDARLSRLAQLERAMFVVRSDLEQMAAGSLSGEGGELSFSRAGAGSLPGVPAEVRYLLAGTNVARIVDRRPPQLVLPDVSALRWRFYAPDLGWTERWPPTDELAARRPQAVELVAALGSGGRPGGTLRRVVVLPAAVAKP